MNLRLIFEKAAIIYVKNIKKHLQNIFIYVNIAEVVVYFTQNRAISTF